MNQSMFYQKKKERKEKAQRQYLLPCLVSQSKHYIPGKVTNQKSHGSLISYIKYFYQNCFSGLHTCTGFFYKMSGIYY